MIEAIKTMPLHTLIFWLGNMLAAVVCLGMAWKGIEPVFLLTFIGALNLSNVFWLVLFQIQDDIIRRLLKVMELE